jgi:hypothetical protein
LEDPVSLALGDDEDSTDIEASPEPDEGDAEVYPPLPDDEPLLSDPDDGWPPSGHGCLAIEVSPDDPSATDAFDGVDELLPESLYDPLSCLFACFTKSAWTFPNPLVLLTFFPSWADSTTVGKFLRASVTAPDALNASRLTIGATWAACETTPRTPGRRVERAETDSEAALSATTMAW